MLVTRACCVWTRSSVPVDGTSHPFLRVLKSIATSAFQIISRIFPRSPHHQCSSLQSSDDVRRFYLHVRRIKCFPLRIQPQVDQCSQSQLPRSQSPELVYGRSALSEFSKWISAVSHSYCAVSHQSLPRLDKAPDGTSIFMSFAPIFMSVATQWHVQLPLEFPRPGTVALRRFRWFIFKIPRLLEEEIFLSM